MADLTVWRPVEEQYSGSAFSGEGARQHGGRFNSPGISVVYTAESLPLALVEMMTGLERYDQLRRYVFFRVGIPQGQLSKLEAEDLPDGWDRIPLPPGRNVSVIGGSPAGRRRFSGFPLSRCPTATTISSILCMRPSTTLRSARPSRFRSTSG